MSTETYGYDRDCHYLVVKEDHIGSKESQALDGVFTNKINAIHFMEEYIYRYIAKSDGEESASIVAYNPLSEVNITYVCQHNLSHRDASSVTTLGDPIVLDAKRKYISNRQTGESWTGVVRPEIKISTVKNFTEKTRSMEKTNVDPRWNNRNSIKFLTYGHYVTRNPDENINRLTVWRKCTKEVPARVYGNTTVDDYQKIFTVTLTEIPNRVYNEVLNNEIETDEYCYADYDLESDCRARDQWRHILQTGLIASDVMMHLENRFQDIEAIPGRKNVKNPSPIKQQLSEIEIPPISITDLRRCINNEFVCWSHTDRTFVPDSMERLIDQDTLHVKPEFKD